MDDIVKFSVTGTGTSSGGGGRPDGLEDNHWDIDRWEDEGGRSPGPKPSSGRD